LSFNYRRYGLDNSSDYVAVSVSSNGGSTWTELGRLQGAATDSSFLTATYNITAYAALNTQIRFQSSGSLGSADYVYLDNIQIRFTKNGGGAANRAPAVNAGADQTITLPATATMSGTASDDGLPSNRLTLAWTKVSGPGTVTFTNTAVVNTRASFSASGTYVLRLSANDAALSSSDDVRVVVNAARQSPSSDVVLTVNAAPSNGAVSVAGEVDWYSFVVPSTGAVTIDTQAGTLTDNYMYLYGPNSKTAQIEEDDDDGTGYMARIVRSLSPGTYYVKIRAYYSTGTGTYTIRVTR
jgi:hypothetical protein